jgi:hypothetical protein
MKNEKDRAFSGSSFNLSRTPFRGLGGVSFDALNRL